MSCPANHYVMTVAHSRVRGSWVNRRDPSAEGPSAEGRATGARGHRQHSGIFTGMSRLAIKKKPRRSTSPGDYEAELVRLCRGNRAEADRLIAEEMLRSPALSRPGAALALVTRIRHQRSPSSRSL